MQFSDKNRYFKISMCALGVIAASMVLVLIVLHFNVLMGWIRLFMNVISPFVWGFSFAYVLNYLYKWLLDKMQRLCKKTNKNLPPKALHITAIVLTYAVFLAAATLFFYMVIPQIVSALQGFVETLPQYLEQFELLMQSLTVRYLKRFDLSWEDVLNVMNAISAHLTEEFHLTDVLGKTVDVLFSSLATVKNMFLGLIVSIYFLWDKERFAVSAKRFTYAVLSKKWADKVVQVMRFTDKTFGGFLIAKIVDSTIIGILCYIFMAIMGMEYAVLISVIVGVTNVIPFFGPFIGAIPSIVLLLLVNPWEALIFAIFIIILQQFDGNFLGPKLMGDSMGIRAVFVVFAVIVGGGLFGVVGMFIGVPCFVVIYTLITEEIAERLDKKNIHIS